VVVTEPAPATDPFGLVGQTLAGRFVIEQQVAEGGFGVVYRARQIALDRLVAIKVLKVLADQEPALHRTFEAEAQTAARLKHPNIVEVHDFGVTESAPGVVLRWMALEWLEGQTLQAFLEKARAGGTPKLEPARALELLGPAIQAIAAAHRQRVVHRDLKPGNIFLVEQHGTVVPKVLDFGIAQMLAIEEEGGATSGNTTRGPAAFSPDYAAPEQVSYGRTGPWTDVHALGLILTELLTGETSYPIGEAEARLAAVMAERRPTPGAKGVDVGAWEAVLQKALARRPADRYSDAGVLLSSLEVNVGAGGRVGPRSGRRGRLLAAIAALGIVVAGSWTAWQTSRPAPPGRVMLAVLPFENLTGDPQQEYFSDGLTDGMISQLSRLQPERLAVIARTSVVQYKQSKKSIKEIGRELNVDYVLESTLRRSGMRARVDARLIKVSDQAQIWADSYDREIKDVLELQADVARAIADGVQLRLTPQTATVLSRKRPLNPEAYEAYLRGRYHLSKSDAEGRRLAFGYLEKAIALDPMYAPAYAALSGAHFGGSQTTRVHPLEAVAKAKAAARRALELDETSPDAHVALANILLGYDWDWAGAERHYRRALELDPNHAETHRQHRRWLQSLGRFPEAIAAANRAIELDPLSVATNNGLVGTYYHSRQYEKALTQAQRTLELDPGNRGAIVRFLTWLNADRGMHAEALSLCARRPDTAICNAYVFARAGKRAQALSEVDRAKQQSPAQYVPPVELARPYAILGDRDEAFRLLEQGLRDRFVDLIFLRIDPHWDSLRGDPRFDALVRRVGIPELSRAGP
jgi:serine/threonine-protein kinase